MLPTPEISSSDVSSKAAEPFCDGVVNPFREDTLFNEIIHWDPAGIDVDGLQDGSPKQQRRAQKVTVPECPSNAPTSLPPSPPTLGQSPGPSDYPIVVVSTAFNAHTISSHTHHPDLELLTADNVLFSVSRRALDNVSCNSFDGILASPDARQVVPDRAEVLNLVLHAAYGMSPIAYRPSVDLIVEAVLRMPAYGMEPATLVGPGSAFYESLHPCIALAPMRAYIAAASRGVYLIAQMASAHLLSYPMQTLADADADAMGALYLKRLLVLQHSRPAWLRELLARPPDFHPETLECNPAAQRALAEAWSRCAALIVAERRPDVSCTTLGAAFASLREETKCRACQKALDARISGAVSDWLMCPMTI